MGVLVLPGPSGERKVGIGREERDSCGGEVVMGGSRGWEWWDNREEWPRSGVLPPLGVETFLQIMETKA